MSEIGKEKQSMEAWTTVKFIVNSLKPYKRLVVYLSFLALVAAGIEVVIPIVYGRVLDSVIAKKPSMLIGSLLLAWLVLRLIVGWFHRDINYQGKLLAHRSSDEFAQEASGRLLDLPMSFHHNVKSQEISERIDALRWTTRDFIEFGIFNFGPTLLASTAMIVYAASLDWRVAIVLLISLGMFLFTNIKRSRKFLEFLEEADEHWRQVESHTWDALRNILIVKSSGREDHERENARVGHEELQVKNKLWIRHYRGTLASQDIISSLGILGAIAFAASGVMAGRLSAGQFLSIIGYAYAIFGYIGWVEWQLVSFLKIVARHKPVEEILSEPRENYEGGADLEFNGDIVFQGVRFRYREDVSLLEDVSFTVRAGEQVAIVGESGEGKTTIVELLGRYILPQGGQILVAGRNINEVNLRSLRSQLAYVPQDLTLFHDTVRANIRYSRPEATDAQVEEAAHLAHLHDFVSNLPDKYETRVGERGLKLSAGERQRVALARAFLRDPKILILDEPTSNLDAKTEELIRASLEKLMKGRITLIIAHRLRTIREASKILVLKDGHIVEQGRHDDLAKQGGVYSELLQVQISFVLPEERRDGILAAH